MLISIRHIGVVWKLFVLNPFCFRNLVMRAHDGRHLVTVLKGDMIILSAVSLSRQKDGIVSDRHFVRA